jgi:hypothetical protein
MILVAGAAGMSGTEIIREFWAHGIPVRARKGAFAGVGAQSGRSGSLRRRHVQAGDPRPRWPSCGCES